MKLDFKRWIPSLLIFLSVSSLLFTTASSVAAATVNPNSATQSGNNGLQISPTRTDLSINPGESTSFQISLKNVSSISLIARGVLNDFESDNNSGTPKLIINPAIHSPHSLRPYLRGLGDVPLNSGQTKNVQFALDVPKDAAPGGYYGAIRYSAVPVNPNENTGPSRVSLTASVASLVLMEINGPVNETLTLDSLNAQRNGVPGTFFVNKGPNSVAIKLTNGGNGFSQPIGHVSVQKGGKQVYSYEFNSNKVGLHSTILPKSSRTFNNPISNTGAFGQYKIVASIAYNQGDSAITLTQRFWVIPKSLVIIIIIVILIIAVLVGVWVARRRRNKRKSHRHTQN